MHVQGDPEILHLFFVTLKECAWIEKGVQFFLPDLRWEFIKENKNVRKEENKKQELDQESDQEKK